MTKTVCIKTYGCQMNLYDSERMADVLAPLGFVCTDDAETADLVILNTCHIREKAAEKVYSELGRLKPLKTRPREQGSTVPLIAVAGCVAQAEGGEIFRRAPQVDMVFGPQNYHRLPEMVARASRAAGLVLETEFPTEPKFDHLPHSREGCAGPSRYLAVQEGCDKFCTFCVVPYTRGAEYARPAGDVVEEAGRFADAGACEITLLGQNVNAYCGVAPDGSAWRLSRLIEEVAEIPGVGRIRYTTSHPTDMTDDLIAAHARVEKLMPYLHLPVQTGSNRVLAAMNRRHTIEDYRSIINRLRAARPDIALSSDFIVGFPGETEGDFRATLDLVDAVGFAQAYSFKYSARPGTPASLEPQVDEAVKADRLHRLQARLDEHQLSFNRRCEGRILPVLFETRGRRPGQLVGKSPYMQAVHADAPETNLGTIQPVHIVAGYANSLAGAMDERCVA
ncbi:MAG: tRNA (N6-isopentenyl adenosine(37)-C2)-methylthiotransferase MiaB [Rhodospirillales bacterium]|nr:tRNA (N6-isopentenyl adenosine(37)-C2)-methylthiotransferase MiaB [Rhodospirillales bacterium]